MDAIPLSPGSRIVWQVAADEALRAGGQMIEPVHLLLGVFSLDKGAGAKPSLGIDKEEVEREEALMSFLLAKCNARDRQLRREIRRRLSPGKGPDSGPMKKGKMSRSAESKRIFAEAESLARQSGAQGVTSVHLLNVLMRSGSMARYSSGTGVDPEQLRTAAASALPPISSFGLSGGDPPLAKGASVRTAIFVFD